MARMASTICLAILFLAGLAYLPGCASRREAVESSARKTTVDKSTPSSIVNRTKPHVALAAHRQPDTSDNNKSQPDKDSRRYRHYAGPELLPSSTLTELESLADAMNPGLRRLAEEAQAAMAKADYVGAMPDPTIGTNIFAYPIETAAGAQRANLMVGQMIPWMSRLDAKSQEALFEAMARQQLYKAERLKVIGDVRALWYRLYVLEKQIETNRANQELLKSLIRVANARVSTGKASQGDVLLGTLEMSKLEEQLLAFEQRLVSAKADLNRTIGRNADHPISIPKTLDASLPRWSHDMLREIAWQQQPEISAAQLRTQATCWGLQVAKLERRPDLSVNATWFAIDDNRPAATTIVDVGQDALSFGVAMNVPLWHHKYDAMEQEAAWKHSASVASVDHVMQRYDSLLRDLWERAVTANETATLYKETLIPQGRQTLEADQQSYSNGAVEFDRVIKDFRNLLMLELGHYRSIGELATMLARIEQAIGTGLATTQVEPVELPPPSEPGNVEAPKLDLPNR